MKFVVYVSLFSLCLLSIMGGALLQGVSLACFTQPVSFVGVIGFTLALFLIRYSVKDAIQALECAFSDVPLEEERHRHAEEVFQFVGKSLFISGILSSLIGFLHLFYNMTDSSKIGAGIALSFVAVLYAACGRLLITLPLEVLARRKNHLSDSKNAKKLIMPLILSSLSMIVTVTLMTHWLEASLFKSAFANLLIVFFSPFVLFLRPNQITDPRKFTALMQAFVLGGIIAFIISSIHTFSNLTEAVWKGVEVSFTGPFYALLFLGILFALKNRFKLSAVNLYEDIVFGCVSIALLCVLFVGVLYSLQYHAIDKVENTSYEITSQPHP